VVQEEKSETAERVCSTTRMFHYFLNPAAPIESVIAEGLVPFSEQKITARGRARVKAWIERTLRLYYMRRLFAPYVKERLGRKMPNSGLFLTPIDFDLIPGSRLERRARVAVPFEVIDPDLAGLTWVEQEERVIRPFGPEALEEAAEKWPAASVREWFAKNPRMMFFYVPQVMTVQGRIAVEREWVELAGERKPTEAKSQKPE
jgi:hypothetical protein